MDLRDHANQLLRTLASQLPANENTPALELDENNECFLTLDERIVVMFYLDDQIKSLIINLPLGPLPTSEERTALMFDLLCGNYCWNLTEGATLGIDRQTGLITLSYLVELPLDPPETIAAIVDKLTAVAEHWMREIKSAAAERDADLDDVPSFGGNLLRA